jgi:FkbM family methyltransferase
MLDGTPLSHAAHCGAPLSQAELGFRSWSAGLDFLALRALFRAASHTVTNRTGAGAHLAVLDVGANVGGGSLLLAEEFQQATVFSFEPQPLVRARLQRALSVANASHGYRFHVVPNAVSNVHGKAVPFYTPRTHSASDSFTGSGLAPRTGFLVGTSPGSSDVVGDGVARVDWTVASADSAIIPAVVDHTTFYVTLGERSL